MLWAAGYLIDNKLDYFWDYSEALLLDYIGIDEKNNEIS
jgi:hypothetical protein